MPGPTAERIHKNLLSSGQPFAVNPPAIEAALHGEGLESNAAFAPGRPLQPFAGYGGNARAWNFPTGYNIVSRPQRDFRVSFETLKSIIDNYDIARMAIGHRIDDVRSLDYAIAPMKGYSGDTDDAVDHAYSILRRPEGPQSNMPFRAWLAKYLEDVLRYDAGTLYRRRDRAGRVIGLKVVSGTTIAPTLDYWGDTPQPPGPAYVQFTNGMPWKWFTTDDIIYTPFRPQPDSPYGFAPLESVLLTANTDLRFQTHFLQYFTAGTVPHGFMTLPEGISTPDQIREYQAYWDALMWGEQEAKHQIKLVPFGSSFEWPRDESFDDKFSVYLMQKVAAAYHVVPSDLGFTNDVNRATGETQVDVQFRVGTLPLVQHIEDILNDYLQNDRGLPVELSFDTGQEKEDRVQVAQAHKIYVEMGAESVDEVRSQELGLPIDNERPMPRFILDPKAGPIPLGNVYSIAGVIDPETAGPSDYVPLGLKPYDGAEGVLASKSPGGAQFARAPQNPDEPNFPQLEHVVPGTDVLGTKPAAPVIGDPGIEDATQADSADSNGVLSKEMTAGVTSATGIVGYDLGGDDDDDDEDFDGAAVTKELATFRAFVKTRARKGKYRDFHFDAVSALNPVWAHRLNDTARARIRKDAGLLVAAGLCVYAMDTTRVLMLQRSLDELDPASGMWEFPGGHLEDGEDAFAAAVREFAEETGCPLPVGSHTGTWTDPTGVYQGFVWTVAEEASVPIFDREDYKNPDDPDGDVIESIAWWPVTLLPGNPAMRAELVASMDAVQSALPQPAPSEAEPVVDDGLVKADVPKGPAGNPRWHQPVRAAEGKAIDHHAAAIRTAMTGAASKDQLRALVAKYMGSNG